jgi:prepilin-type N-terminal cleavage/methylation domain-containing protein
MTNSILTFIRRHASRAAAGFTLIETLVAVLILTTAIAGPLTLASKSLTTALVAKDQVTAFYLAQDAVEYVRFKRDSTCLSGGSPCANWLSTLSACTGGSCYLDSTENSPASTPQSCSATCPALKYDTTNNRFTYASPGSGVVATIYTRTVSITTISSDEAKLTVEVKWNDTGGNPRTVTVNENIFNWQ